MKLSEKLRTMCGVWYIDDGGDGEQLDVSQLAHEARILEHQVATFTKCCAELLEKIEEAQKDTAKNADTGASHV